MEEHVGGLPYPGCSPSHQMAFWAAQIAVVMNDAHFQTSLIFSLVFKRISGFFISCPVLVPSPSQQLNYFFPFLKKRL